MLPQGISLNDACLVITASCYYFYRSVLQNVGRLGNRAYQAFVAFYHNYPRQYYINGRPTDHILIPLTGGLGELKASCQNSRNLGRSWKIGFHGLRQVFFFVYVEYQKNQKRRYSFVIYSSQPWMLTYISSATMASAHPFQYRPTYFFDCKWFYLEFSAKCSLVNSYESNPFLNLISRYYKYTPLSLIWSVLELVCNYR